MEAEKENDVSCNEEKVVVKKKKPTSFELANQFSKTIVLVRIDGVLHWFSPYLEYYCPAEKSEIENFLLNDFYEDVQGSNLGTVKECVDILLRRKWLNYPSADKQMILCLQNGFIELVNMETAKFIPYNSTNIPKATYRIEAQGKLPMTIWDWAKRLRIPWMDYFVGSIAQGNEVIATRIWQMIGYLLTPDTSAKAWFLLQGVPNSGKSVIGNFLSSLFPEHKIASLDIDQLGRRTATSLLVNKCLNISMDLPNKALSPVAVRSIKLMTGNDDITVEFGNGRYQKYHSNCKFLFASNHALTLKGSDSGFEDRIVCIPFTKSVAIAERNNNLLQNLLNERDDIVIKALAHYRDLRRANYEFAGSNLDICKPNIRYLPVEAEDSDAHLCEFVDTQCEIVPVTSGRTYTSTLHKAYFAFCLRNNYTPLNDIGAFSRRLYKCYGDRLKKEKWRDGQENQNGFAGIVLIGGK